MKRKILAVLLVLALVGAGLSQIVPALADSGNPLDHVVVSPASISLGVGTSQQFIAQAYDSNNQPLSNISYFWLVTAGGGSIDSTGNFTAGGIPGTYINTVEVVAVQGSITRIATATVTVTGTAGILNHIVVTPASTTVAPGSSQQFTAQGYDVNNVAIPGLIYNWSVVAGGGTITNTGLFTAGTATGTFTNTIQVSVAPFGITGQSTVIVATAPPTTSIPNINTNNLIRMFTGYINNLGFANFLGGQWQIKNGTSIDTVNIIPGIVQTAPLANSSNLVILENGQTAASTFSLNSGVVILPKGTTLAANDEVVVVTVNNQLSMVVKITPASSQQTTSSGQIPPGLRKNGNDDNREGKQVPPGWSHGKKIGWGDKSQNNNAGPETDN